MGWFSDDSDEANAYDQVVNAPHKAELSHELIAAAASYEVRSLFFGRCMFVTFFFQAAKAYENHVAENGQPESHARAKEIL